MVLDYGNGIRRGITRAIYHYDEADNKYLHECDETEKMHTINILILIIDTDMPYRNHFFVVGVIMLKIYQCLCMILLITVTKTDLGYTLIVGVNYPEYLQPCNGIILTHFMPQISFYTPWKHQKTRCFDRFYLKK